MPGSTPNFGYPFPLGNERINVAVDIQRLAEAIDGSAGVSAGVIQMTIATVPDPGFLFLVGQTVPGADALYPKLWAKVPAQWKSGSSLIFPDMRQASVGGFLAGSPSHGVLGAVGGANTKVIGTGNLPPHHHSMNHDHAAITITGGGHEHTLSNHSHGGTTADGGYHEHGWTPGVPFFYNEGTGASGGLTPGIGGIRLAPWSAGPNHTHTFGTGGPSSNTTAGGGGHSHTVDLGLFSGNTDDGTGFLGTPLNVVSSTLAVNFQIKAH